MIFQDSRDRSSDDSGESAEQEIPMLHEDSRLPGRGGHDHQSSEQQLRWWINALRTTLEITLCVLLFWNLGPGAAESVNTSKVCDKSDSIHKTTFGGNREFMSLDHKYDQLWSDEESAYKALIQTNPGEPRSKAEWGSIAMFHQLHCLTSFRTAMQNAREGVEIGIDYLDNKHWPHCFWYLRQAILCNADDLIELPHEVDALELPNGTRILRHSGSVNGANDIRTCRDSTKLYELRLERGVEAAGYKLNVTAERVESDALIRNDTSLTR